MRGRFTNRVVAAVDLGGTRCKAGAVESGTGRLLDVLDTTPTGSTWAAASAVAGAAVAELRASHGASVVGIAMPGVIDGGRVIALPGKFPGAEGVDVAAQFGALVVNDAVAAGVGEAVAGAGAGHHRVLVVTLGTGVGVCVIEDGRPLGGGPFGGGTLGGQVPVGGDAEVPDAVRRLVDTAGRTGTIEARCRAAALPAHAQAAGGPWTDAEAVFAAAVEGDRRALIGVEDYRRDLVRGLVALSHAHAPTCVIVGGGVASPGGHLLDGVEDAVNTALRFGLEVSVRPAGLGDAAALAGLGVLCGDRS